MFELKNFWESEKLTSHLAGHINSMFNMQLSLWGFPGKINLSNYWEPHWATLFANFQKFPTNLSQFGVAAKSHF